MPMESKGRWVRYPLTLFGAWSLTGLLVAPVVADEMMNVEMTDGSGLKAEVVSLRDGRLHLALTLPWAPSRFRPVAYAPCRT